MDLGKIKKVDLNTLDGKVEEHINDVLGLEKEEIIEYLNEIVDIFYLESDNTELIEEIFHHEKLKPYYEEIMQSLEIK
jgi:hypothetical protein